MKKKANYVMRRKNKVTVYYSNVIGCPQPAWYVKVFNTIEEAKEFKKLVLKSDDCLALE